MRARRRRPSEPSLAPQPMGVLLYRYLFFEWLFRDVSRGSPLERAAAWRFNRQMRRYLPTYLRRWAMIVVLSYALGAWFDRVLLLGYAGTFFYCVSALSVAMSVLIMRAWLGLRFE
jgi:hypothetical protein